MIKIKTKRMDSETPIKNRNGFRRSETIKRIKTKLKIKRMRTEIKHENTKTTLMVLLITQNTHENTKIPPKKASFLFFLRLKILFYYT
jgi:hypothetical protein